MGHSKHPVCSTQTQATPAPAPTPPPPPIIYNVTGPIWPDARCNYVEQGTYLGAPYFKREDGMFYLFRAETGQWYISASLGDYEHGGWGSITPNIVEDYSPDPPCVGFASVSLGEHEPIVGDYHVTGTITPDATGNYKAAGILLENIYYKHLTKNFYVWFDPPAAWHITDLVGTWDYYAWNRENPGILGDYPPEYGVSGTATVVEGPV
jgi:hypothetical protein